MVLPNKEKRATARPSAARIYKNIKELLFMGAALPGHRDRTRSGFDANALPERHVILDLCRLGLRLRVIPRGIVILHASDLHVIVVCRAFPGTFTGMRAGFQELLVYRVQRKILVPFHDDGGAAFGDSFAAPDCFGHAVRSNVKLDQPSIRKRLDGISSVWMRDTHIWMNPISSYRR